MGYIVEVIERLGVPMSADLDKDFILTLVILILIIIRLVGNSKSKDDKLTGEDLKEIVRDEAKKLLEQKKDE